MNLTLDMSKKGINSKFFQGVAREFRQENPYDVIFNVLTPHEVHIGREESQVVHSRCPEGIDSTKVTKRNKDAVEPVLARRLV